MILVFLQPGAGRSVARPPQEVRDSVFSRTVLREKGRGKTLVPQTWDLLPGLSTESLGDLLTSCWKKELSPSYVFLFGREDGVVTALKGGGYKR